MTSDARSESLLVRPTFSIRTPGGSTSTLSLTELLATLGSSEVEAFLGLQAHQTHAWHAFLVQLAAIAMHRGDQTEVPVEATSWESLLLALTDDRYEPWTLVVEDLAHPAFMQPPVPEGTLNGFGDPVVEPDQIDVLLTSRNHDVKGARIHRPRDEHWVFALVSLQTMEGFSGRDNYGVARMNGGFGSRVAVGFMNGFGLAGRFRDDVHRVLSSRSSMLQSGHYGYAASDGVALCWLASWDGSAALGASQLDPMFIEVCRRMRLVRKDGRIAALRKATTSARIESKAMLGNTGDAWTPVDKASGKSLTIGEGGFHYALMQRLVLGGDFSEGAAMTLRPTANAESGVVLSAMGLARGQGKTSGFHQRFLPIPARALRRLGSVVERDALRHTAQERVELAAATRKGVLKIALCVLLQSGAEKIDFRDEGPAPWLEAFDRRIDRLFFDELWRDTELTVDEARTSWLSTIRHAAFRELQDAIATVPLQTVRRFRAIAAAERAFAGTWNKHFATPDDTEDS